MSTLLDWKWLPIIFIATAMMAHAGESPELIQNGGFEIQDAANPALPADWKPDVKPEGNPPVYQLDDARPHGGSRCVRVTYHPVPDKDGYAGVIQNLDAATLAGKRLDFEAYIKRDSEKCEAGIWILVGDENKQKLLYVNSYEQPFAEPAGWNRHHLEVFIPVNAKTIKLGAAVYGAEGVMWVDDVSLSSRLAEMGDRRLGDGVVLLGPAPAHPEAAHANPANDDGHPAADSAQIGVLGEIGPNGRIAGGNGS